MNYYGIRAAQWLETLGQTPPLPPLPEVEDLATWLAGWTSTSDALDLSAPLPEFQRPTALHRLGEEGTAYAVFESLRQRWQDDPLASLRLALYTQELGYYDISLRAAARVATLSGKPWQELPPALQRLIYPIYYPDLIAHAAQTYKLDPDLLLALIRQESHFGATATSGAAARGLAQVIPSTGRAIAQQLGFGDYRDELLYRPYVSVDFGAFYLAQGIEQADGSVVQALAGYNGGPGNAAYWREQAGPDDDLFLEIITFAETQHYVRSVLWQAAIYRWLYPQFGTH
jgi:soluble lytic murein transglycosylase